MIIQSLKCDEKSALSCNTCLDEGRGIKTKFVVYFNDDILVFECAECSAVHYWVKR